jgi:phage terminase large subunit-like protein
MPKGAEKFGAWYDHAAAAAAVKFFADYLRHTEGQFWGKQFRLAPWQELLIRQIFGWKRADGTRLIRQAYVEVPRGNGKTEFAAGVVILLLVADGERGGQGYSMALSKEQSQDTIFKKVGVMIGLSPALQKAVQVLKTSIFCPALQSSFKPLSSKAASKHGFSPSFSVSDELHEWPDGELFDVVHKGTGKRTQPLEIMITTAGEPGIGYGWEVHEYAEQIISGVLEDPTFLGMIYAADPKDDWQDPATWRKANPNLGISIHEDYLAAEVVKAQGNARKIGDFKRYHLNIWNEKAVSTVNMAAWDAVKIRPVNLETLRGRRCIAALDLSSTTDLTSLTLLAENEPEFGGFDAWWKFWMPSEGIKERARNDRVPYDRWIDQGYITATEGNVVDYDAIRTFISGADTPSPLKNIVEIAELAIDRWNATQITTQLQSDGVNIVAFGQGFASMSAPSKEFERLLGKGLINHGGNPVARWMATCTTFCDDGAENIKPVKFDRRKSIKRIDGIVTLIMALGRMVATAAPAPRETPLVIMLEGRL